MAEETATGNREWAGLWLSEERFVPYLEASEATRTAPSSSTSGMVDPRRGYKMGAVGG